MNICAVFVCNSGYFNQFQKSCNELITCGNYNGPICLVIGDDMNHSSTYSHPFILKNNIIVKYFPDLAFPETILQVMKTCKRDAYWFDKRFQYHKLHLFNTFFKHWDTIFYIDCGATIFSDIKPILDTRQPGRFLAHSDAYPTYVNKLHCQFTKDLPYFDILNSTYDISGDYPQSTIMLYDTSIITESTFDDLYNLTVQFPNSQTNDQGIIALYFSSIRKIWTQIPIENTTHYLYDFMHRTRDKPYIILKRDWY
jgi:hypothetical protein